MPLAAALTRKIAESKLIHIWFTITPTGNYAALGEIPTPTIPVLAGMRAEPLECVIEGKAGFVYIYDYATGKIMVFCNTAGGVNGPLVEHTAVDYVAGIDTDVIKGRATFLKQL